MQVLFLPPGIALVENNRSPCTTCTNRWFASRTLQTCTWPQFLLTDKKKSLNRTYRSRAHNLPVRNHILLLKSEKKELKDRIVGTGRPTSRKNGFSVNDATLDALRVLRQGQACKVPAILCRFMLERQKIPLPPAGPGACLPRKCLPLPKIEVQVSVFPF